MSKVAGILSLICVAIIANGCSTVRELARTQTPSVAVANARIAGLSFETIDLAVDLKVSNPNPFSIPLAGLDYEVSLAGHSVFTGDRPQSVSVPGQGERIVSLPISLRFEELYAAVAALGGRDEAPYGVACGLTFNVHVLGPTRVPVNHTGTLPLVRLPKVALRGLRVKSLSVTGAAMDIVLGVDNPNAFDLSMQRIDYDLAINGSRWASGRSEQTAGITRKQKGEVRIPVNLDFLRIGSGIYELISDSSPVSYTLAGALEMGTSLPLLRNSTLPLNESGTIRLSR